MLRLTWLVLAVGCAPALSPQFGTADPPGDVDPPARPEAEPVPVEVEALQVEGSSVDFTVHAPFVGEVDAEVVWMLEVDEVRLHFVDGQATVRLPLHDPCAHLPLGFLQGVVRGDGWDTTFALALSGQVVELVPGASVPVVVGAEPVALCGETERVDLWVEEAATFVFDRRGEANIVVRAGNGSANLPSAMALPQGGVTLDVLEHQGPFVLVIARSEG